MTRPSVFIGSSTEGLDVARALQFQLSDDANVTLWNDGVFALTHSYLESLIKALDSFDFAILVFRADDVVTSREITSPAARGNVLFELGLFMGRLGRTRTFVAYDKHKPPGIISDLSGISFAPYDTSRSDNLLAALGPACFVIREAIKKTGVHKSERNELSNPDFKFFALSGDYKTQAQWLQILKETENRFDIMGIALGSWRRTKDFKSTILKKAEAGCKVRILFMHKENPSLEGIVHPIDEEQSLAGVVNDIDQSFAFFSRISQENSNIEIRQMLRGCPNFFLTMSDQLAVVIQYLYSEVWGNGPVWECGNDSKLYNILKQEFDTLWNLNSD